MPQLPLGMALVIAFLAAALAGTGWLYNGALKEKARVQGEYESFKGGVEKLGRAAEERYTKALKEQERNYNARLASWKKRRDDATVRADRLCKSAGLSAGCSSLSSAPDTSRPADDAARDQRLLTVLRHAQDTTDKLIELQAFISTLGQAASLQGSSSAP